MFESLSYLTLQEYWWFLIAVLAGMFVFMTFVQGGQTLLHTLGKTEAERDVIVNSLGRKWELTFTSLVMFGGALFAAFPLFYAVSFGGAYFVWMAILFCFIIQAVAYEYRKKPNNLYGEKTYETFMFINGSLGVILIGTAVGTLFTGGNFTLNEMNLSRWTIPYHGLEAVLNPFNVAFGLMLFFLARILASLYFINNIDEDTIVARAKTVLKRCTILFLIVFLYVAGSLLVMKGYAYNPVTKTVFVENGKYLHNFLDMPLVLVVFIAGVLLLLTGIFTTIFKNSRKGIWFSGTGTVLTVVALFLILGFNNTAFYPSLSDLQSSLTIENSSSSKYTLTAMGYVSLMVPFVLAYIAAVWRAMNRKQITIKEIENDDLHY